MALPLQITVRDLPNSEFIENDIRLKVDKLTEFYTHILSCHVVVDCPQKHKHQGKLYAINIELAVPGKELVVNHKKGEDLYVVIRDGFNAMRRQLEDFAQRQRQSS